MKRLLQMKKGNERQAKCPPAAQRAIWTGKTGKEQQEQQEDGQENDQENNRNTQRAARILPGNPEGKQGNAWKIAPRGARRIIP
jgi:hypothetical protein